VRQNLPNKGDSGADDMAAPMGNGAMGNGSMGGASMGGGGGGGNSNALQSALQVIAGLVGNNQAGGMAGSMGGGSMGNMGGMDVGAARQSAPRGTDAVVVKNLPYDCNWMLLRDRFGQAGRVTYAEKTGNGVGLIKFSNDLEAERAVKLLDGMAFDGRTMKVSLY